MGPESFNPTSPANDNFDTEAIHQQEGEAQRALYSVLQRDVSSNVWTLLGNLSLIDSFEKFQSAVEMLNTLDRNDVGALPESEEEVGVLNFRRGWKLRVLRSLDGVYSYEAIG